MAFRKTPPSQPVPDSPEKILLQLPRRKIPGVLLHQGQIMQRYVAEAQGVPDVALQLPTGSGKTLVGLLIGEWRRIKNSERVVYLCPTRQLVNQVVSQAEEQYGLSVHGFTGSRHNYDPTARSEYQSATKLAVTTYNSLFNTNPFFDSADIIIVDDAHASENYISSMWSVKIERRNKDHSTLHQAICESLLKPILDSTDFGRLTGQLDDSLADLSWSEKIPSPQFAEVRAEFAVLVDEYVPTSGDLRFQWQMLRDHLDACHLYLTPQEILLRPLIPPTWTHEPFTRAKQRLFMSATLGEGGDLERLTGRSSILRLPVPEGWDRQGIGRRFFMFPEMSLDEESTANLRRELMARVPRSVVLVPNDHQREEVAADALEMGLSVFDAAAIEDSKEAFVNLKNATAVFANRYDGIDFPGDECRLLFIDGLPKTTNAQERFLVSRMGAGNLLRGRIQTRVVQAVGRCTRSLQDYSAVVITGAEMTDYLNNPSRRVFFHPELQAELQFGAEQSTGTSLNDLLENFDTFLRNDADWEEVNKDILAKRSAATQQPHPGIADLGAVVTDEIDYQRRLWQGHYEEAVEAAGRVLARLTDPELKGYRALWHYLAGTAAWYGSHAGVTALAARARAHFAQARDASSGIRWLANLARYQTDGPVPEAEKQALDFQIERLEALLLSLGTLHEARYTKHEKTILEGISSADAKLFEMAHKNLGEMLGFCAGLHNATAAPDPWWIAGEFCIVFEDHSDANPGSTLGAAKARQVAGHPLWMRDNKALTQLPDSARIVSVLVTPVSKAEAGALPHLTEVSLWPLEEFRAWARAALSTIRGLRRSLGEEGDLVWRAQAQSVFEEKQFDAPSVFRLLNGRRASDLLK